jgi:hypothetical protein
MQSFLLNQLVGQLLQLSLEGANGSILAITLLSELGCLKLFKSDFISHLLSQLGHALTLDYNTSLGVA